VVLNLKPETGDEKPAQLPVPGFSVSVFHFSFSYAERRKSMVESRRGKLAELDSALEPLTFDF